MACREASTIRPPPRNDDHLWHCRVGFPTPTRTLGTTAIRGTGDVNVPA
jgi:hypothetical protein